MCHYLGMKNAAFFGQAGTIDRVYGQGRKEQVASATCLYPEVVGAAEFDTHVSALQDLEVIFSSWGMPALSGEQWARLPRLAAVFYAAGSVQHFARPLLERGVVVVSAWQANAVPVAEFTLGQILLATKGYFRNVPQYKRGLGRGAYHGKGNYGETVAILGSGAIGRRVIGLLRHFALRVVVFDPFLSDMDAQALGVERVTLEEAFGQAYVVSNHLANKPETVGLLNADLFHKMRDDATFINTGRGATVDEEALIAALQARPSLTALLDVTFPEPPLPESPLYRLLNVFLSSHIAGAIGDEVVRMADYCLEEFEAWSLGKPLRYEVTLAMLEHMA